MYRARWLSLISFAVSSVSAVPLLYGQQAIPHVSMPLTLSGSDLAPSESKWPTIWKSDLFSIYSTVPTSSLEPVAHKLELLPKQISKDLGIVLSRDIVRVVVLRNVEEYEWYLKKHFPNVPKRRALYVQNRSQSLVITYFHRDWIEDARHECTHALLHHSGIQLPLWLDEGLAEYFETDQSATWQHPVHSPAIRAQLRFGQVVQLEELEAMRYETLDAKGYRDAWSIVAFLLNQGADGRSALQAYLADLQKGTAAGFLSRRLSESTRLSWREQYTRFYQEPRSPVLEPARLDTARTETIRVVRDP